MGKWWQKITIDWPCALGDWLWVVLVVAPPRIAASMTRRKVLHIVGFLLLLIFFQYVALLDLTFLFGFDLGLLMEVSAGVFVIALREGWSSTYDRGKLKVAAMKARIVTSFRRCARRTRRVMVSLKLPPTDDERHVFGSVVLVQ